MTNKNIIKKAERESLNIKDKLLETLNSSAPEIFAEGRVNWDKLQRALGEHIESSAEKFNFTWAGKSSAITNVLVPSKATLFPAKNESVDFNESENVFIEGDNLEVLKLLQKSYFEKVKMIYIDPPYNTGNDFVYKDDFKSPLKNYLEQSGQVDNEGNRLSTNTQASGRFHSDWLTMMYPRLKLAWNLLRHDGVIFINIGNRELHHLLMLMDEIFGEENSIENIIWRKKAGGGQQDDYFVTEHDYIVCYAKDKSLFSLNEKKIEKSIDEFRFIDTISNKHYKQVKLAKWGSAALKEDRPTMYFPLINPDGQETFPIAPDGRDGRWRYGKMRVNDLIASNSIDWEKRDGKWIPYEKQYAPEDGDLSILKERSIFYDLVENTEGANELTDIFGVKDIFQNPKPSDLILHLALLSTHPNSGDIVLDFFAGSGSTAHAIMQLNTLDGGNRKYILVQLPEKLDDKPIYTKFKFATIADICKERIRRVIKGYGNNKSINDGFKVFKLGKSNYYDNLFEYDPEKSDEDNEQAFKQYLDKAQKELFPGKVNDPGIIYENIIKEGLNLNAIVETVKIGKNDIFKISDEARELYISTDDAIKPAAVDVLTGKEYKDKTFICFDSALSDTDKANLSLNLTLKTI